MNITIVANSFGFGGAEKMVFFLAESLSEKGYSVSMVNLNIWTSETRTPSEGIKFKTANIKHEGRVKTHFNYIKFVYDAAKEFKSDVLVAFTDMANFCVPIVGKLLRIPSIISERGDPESVYGNASFFMKMKFRIMNTANAAVFQTEGAQRQYCKKIRKNSIVVPNPIFIKESIPPIDYEKRPYSIVSLSRLSNNSQKRFDIMLKSFARFHDSFPNYTLIIYGDGDCKEMIEQLAQELGIRDSIRLMGRTSNALKDISQEGIFLTTSDYEGISNSLLEAMAVGLPIVSTDHKPGGARLLIQDHINGLLVPCGDSNAISNALCEMARDTKLAEKCGKEATKVLERFSPIKTISAWESFIQLVYQNYHC